MDLKEIVHALRRSKFTCIAGNLENHIAFVFLESMLDNETVCCLGEAHPCRLNVNDGFCVAQKCQYQVQEKSQKSLAGEHDLNKVAPFKESLSALDKISLKKEKALWWDCKYCGENEEGKCHKCVREDGLNVSDELCDD